MRRRRFMELLGAASIAGSTVASVGSAGSVSTGVSSLEFDSSSSFVAVDGSRLTDESAVAVWAGPDAENEDADWYSNAVYYGSDPIPLVAVDGDVVGVGAPLVADSKMDGDHDNVQFLLNTWDELVDGNQIAWDDAHDTYWTLDKFSTFKAEAQSAGYVLSAAGDLERELQDADAFVMMPPRRDVTDAERAAISEFLADGGTVFLHNQSDYNDYDQSQRLNYVARGLGLDFRFNDDQVIDYASNAGASYEPVTSNFNPDFPFFGDGGGGGTEPDPNDPPTASFTTSADTVTPDETVTFDAGGSSDDDGTISAYEWSFGDGATATGETVDHAYGSTGDYAVSLSVTDDDGATATATRTVTVESSGDGGGTDRMVATVTNVFDGDTVEIETPEGTTESVRVLGLDTPEVPGNADKEYPPEWEGIESKDALGSWGQEASKWAKDHISTGDTIEVGFDEREGKRDFFDRLLGYIYYDADGDGSRDTFYNEQIVRDGYARVYGSSLTKHDRIQAAESEARANDRGLWVDSDPLNSEVIRNGTVDELFVPKATRVTSASGSLPDSRVPVAAEPSASPSEAPLVGVDEDANVAMLGGMMPTDDYEKVDGFAADTSNYSNYAFVANLVDYLAEKSGDVAFEGAHGQFSAQFSMSNEDAAFFQRFLEPFGIDVDQFNDLAAADLSGYKAVFVAAPTSALSSAQVDALSTFTADGGAVILLGTAASKKGGNGYVDDVASALGSDLRLDSTAVTDRSTNVDGNEDLPATSNFSSSFPLFSPYSTGGSTDSAGGSSTETFEGTVDPAEGVVLNYETRTSSPDTVTLTLEGPSSGDLDLYATLDGRTPTIGDYDARSWTYGSSEEMTLDAVSADTTVGVLVNAYRGSGDFTLTVEESAE